MLEPFSIHSSLTNSAAMLLLSYIEDPVFENRWMFSQLIRFIMECECSTLEGGSQLVTLSNLEIDDCLLQ